MIRGVASADAVAVVTASVLAATTSSRRPEHDKGLQRALASWPMARVLAPELEYGAAQARARRARAGPQEVTKAGAIAAPSPSAGTPVRDASAEVVARSRPLRTQILSRNGLPAIPLSGSSTADPLNAMGASLVPSVTNVFIAMLPADARNAGSQVPMTSGDEPGVRLPTIGSPATFTQGSPMVMFGGLPAITLTGLSSGNRLNTPVGATLVPSIFTMLRGT